MIIGTALERGGAMLPRELAAGNSPVRPFAESSRAPAGRTPKMLGFEVCGADTRRRARRLTVFALK